MNTKVFFEESGMDNATSNQITLDLEADSTLRVGYYLCLVCKKSHKNYEPAVECCEKQKRHLLVKLKALVKKRNFLIKQVDRIDTHIEQMEQEFGTVLTEN